MNPPFPKRIHPCLCAHTLRNTPGIPSEYLCVWNDVHVEYAADSHLNLSTRSSRHQLSNLPQINATCQVHLPGVDLQNVQTGLFMQINMLRLFQTNANGNICCKALPLHLEGETRSSCQSCLVWVKPSPKCQCGLWPLWPEVEKVKVQLKWTRFKCAVNKCCSQCLKSRRKKTLFWEVIKNTHYIPRLFL